MFSVGIVGGSGYTGAELLRLCLGHPDVRVAWATADTYAGTAVVDLYPSLASGYSDFSFVAYEPALLDGVDLVFLALPHGASQRLVPDVLARGCRVVDLSADFRLLDATAYERWYGERHTCPELLGRLAYGLPELNRDQIAKSDGVAAAGCYPTAAAVALAPLVQRGMIEPEGVIVDAASGVSGAGRALKHTTHFGTANEDFVAYGLLHHRHTPEIEQATGARVLFTPHLVPMTRGVLATCYARPVPDGAGNPVRSTDGALEVLAEAYADEPFVVVSSSSPSTKATWGSNAVHLSARYDDRTGWLIVLAALDNLVKGASGQALQCANLLLGVPETAGLSAVGIYP